MRLNRKLVLNDREQAILKYLRQQGTAADISTIHAGQANLRDVEAEATTADTVTSLERLRHNGQVRKVVIAGRVKYTC